MNYAMLDKGRVPQRSCLPPTCSHVYVVHVQETLQLREAEKSAD